MTAPTIHELVPGIYDRAARCCLDDQHEYTEIAHAVRKVVLARHAHYHEGRDDAELTAELERVEAALRRIAPDHELLAGE